jgi:hypothetical protein
MLGAEEVPAKYNASRKDFYEVLETHSLSFTLANFDNDDLADWHCEQKPELETYHKIVVQV